MRNGTIIGMSISDHNFLMAQWRMLDRLGELLLDERGVDDLTIGNVYIYRAEGGGVGGWFVDENGEQLKPLNYAFSEFGLGTPTVDVLSL